MDRKGHVASELLWLEVWNVVRLAAPVALAELGWMSMATVDTIMVGHLSPAAIGAVGVSSAIFYAPALFGIGLLLGLDTLVAHAYGRGDYDDCHRALAQGVYLAIAYAPLAMLLVGFAPHIFPLLKINEAVRVPAREYLELLNLSALPLLLYVAFRRYLQGVGKVRPVTFAKPAAWHARQRRSIHLPVLALPIGFAQLPAQDLA